MSDYPAGCRSCGRHPPCGHCPQRPSASLGWKDHAACRDRTELNWFSDIPDPACEAVCAVCPVTSECLSEALGRDREWDPGMWGGTTPRERNAIREGTAWQRQLI